jgi:hypothetical protein
MRINEIGSAFVLNGTPPNNVEINTIKKITARPMKIN